MANSPKRNILTLSGEDLSAEDGDAITTMGVYDCLLPCRNYIVQHKASVLGAVSLSSEFVLRLLKSLNHVSEDRTASFFGFSTRELSFILRELDKFGYIHRENGVLSLSAEGESLFSEVSRFPMIFRVEERTARFGMDLVSFSISKWSHLSNLQLRFPELKILDQKAASAGADKARNLFTANFLELSRDSFIRPQDRPSLYSIDAIIPANRFPSIVRVTVGSKRKSPDSAEITLSDWDNIEDMTDRAEIHSSAQKFANDLSISRDSSDEEAYSVLTNAATEFLSEWTTKEGLSKHRYYLECLRREGEVRSDRQTVTVVGSLFVRENLRRLLDQIRYAKVDENWPKNFFWLAPDVIHWGATTSLPEIVQQLQKDFGEEDHAPHSIAILAETQKWYIEKAFDETIQRKSETPKNLEVLLVPNKLCSVIVHAPLNAPRGSGVPLGFISRDMNVIDRVHRILADFYPSKVGA